MKYISKNADELTIEYVGAKGETATEIETEIKNYSGCKTCKKQIILNNKNLSITHPQLLSEWYNNKNE